MSAIRTVSYSCILAVATGFLTARAVGAEIQRVDLKVPDGPSSVERDLGGARLGALAGDVVLSGGEVVEVYWTPGRGVVKAGSGVTLEYRRTYGAKLHTEVRPINANTSVPRKTIFHIEAADSVQFDGAILMWRVRLVQEGKVLAEKTSANWR